MADRHRDYKRDRQGRVSIAEFNRHLPMIRCTDCRTWMLADAHHSYEDCERIAAVRRNRGEIGVSRG